MNLFRFFPGYETYIYGGDREPALLILLAFILTLAGTRFYTRMARIRGWGSVHIGEAHVHHLVPGVVMTLFAGGLAVGLQPMRLHLDDVYWTTEGRLSIDACLAAVAFIGLAILATFPLPTDHGNERLARTLGDSAVVLSGGRPADAAERGPHPGPRGSLGASPGALLRPDRRRATPRLETRLEDEAEVEAGPGSTRSAPRRVQGSEDRSRSASASIRSRRS